MIRVYGIVLIVLFSLVISGCDTSLNGDFNENQPPKTYLTVNSINRSGDNRLSSQINISWWGVDPDGYILFYEYAINDTSEGAWQRVYGTDSTFVLPITEGQQTDDVLFKIRAVDDDSARDETGARLVYPIVNSNPEVSLNRTQLPPDTLFGIASFGWTISDPDGLANISRTEIAVNDTAAGWTEVPFETDDDQVFVSLEVENSTPGPKTAEIYLGRSYQPAGITIDGVEVGSSNKFFVRVVDQAGSVSNVDSVSWYTKRQKSKVLFFNDVSGSASEELQGFHLSLLADNGIEPDIWLINDGTAGENKERISEAFPTTVDPTLTKTLANWDHIYWVSNGINRNINFAPEIAGEFIDQGGNFFINIPIIQGATDNNDPILDFLSVDSIAVLQGLVANYEIDPGTELEKTNADHPTLVTSARYRGTLPLKHSSSSTLLYTADFIEDNFQGPDTDYTGFESVAILNAEQNIVYFGLALPSLDGNGNVGEIIETFCIDLLGFEQ